MVINLLLFIQRMTNNQFNNKTTQYLLTAGTRYLWHLWVVGGRLVLFIVSDRLYCTWYYSKTTTQLCEWLTLRAATHVVIPTSQHGCCGGAVPPDTCQSVAPLCTFSLSIAQSHDASGIFHRLLTAAPPLPEFLSFSPSVLICPNTLKKWCTGTTWP